MIKTLIFDLDGTLVDSLSGLASAVNRTLEEVGEPAYSEEIIRGFIGDGLWMLLRRAFDPEKYSDVQITSFQSLFQKHYAHTWITGTTPYPGIRDLLKELRGNSLQLGVLSNKPHAFTVEIVESLFGRELIAHIYGQREGVPKKPSPEALLSLCDELEVLPSNVLYIGDSTIDLETASKAGTQALGVSYGYHEPERLTAYGFPLCEDVAALRSALFNLLN